jgi:hypothetical protein
MLGSPPVLEQEARDGDHDDSMNPGGPNAGPRANFVVSESHLRK